MIPPKALVLYHGNCPDGFTSAWAAWRKLRDAGADYVAVNYGEPFPNCDIFRPIYILDFSYPRATLDAVFAEHKAPITIIDHHKTAQAVLADLPDAIFDMNHSGAYLSWKYFNNGSEPPALVRYAEDRDLWRFALPHSRAAAELLIVTEHKFEEWDILASEFDHEFDGVVKQGELLLRVKCSRVENVCRNARLLSFGEHRIPVVNSSWDFSEIGEKLCELYPQAPCGGYYFDRDAKRQWGFRSRGDFDVSELCKRYGGGGHAAAAGFTSEIGWLPQ